MLYTLSMEQQNTPISETTVISVAEDGRTIVGFNEADPQFAMIRDVFAANGVDIRTLTDYWVYLDYRRQFRRELFDVMQSRVANRPGNSLETRFIKAAFSDDFETAKQLGEIIQKRNQLGLKRVK